MIHAAMDCGETDDGENRCGPAVWIDCTLTVEGRFRTGVQRVVRMICREALAAADRAPNAPKWRPVVSRSGIFHHAAMDGRDEMTLRPSGVPPHWGDDITANLPRAYRRLAGAVCDARPNTKLRQWLLPLPGHGGVYKPLIKFSRKRLRFPPPPAAPLRRGDVLLLPDAYWSARTDWEAIEGAKSAGVSLIFVLYDLIPHLHASWYDADGVASFRGYLKKVLALADGVVCISRTVASQLQDYAASEGEIAGRLPPVTDFPLGADIAGGGGTAAVRRQLRELFGPNVRRTPYLMVGSVEVRKNHDYALEALRRLWPECPQAQLLVVGRTGHGGRGAAERIMADPRFGDRLFLLQDVTDAELAYCYASARGVLFPSKAEGFGLPIVEALHCGRRVFASDLPIHREVGGSDIEYCELSDPNSLAAALLGWERRWGDNRPAPGPPRSLVSWPQSYEALRERVESFGLVSR